MRERVAAYSQSQTVNAAGEITSGWSLIATIWARVEPLSASQIVLANRDDAQRIYKMVIRYRTDITTNSRIIWRNRKFDVTGVMDETEQRQFLTVMLLEINA
ncbi:head tail joining protein [Caudoviricetes sp.]|nr:head tail joining protein [Caudoviricetes sp.]UOF81505.1 head tail joining protein [Caudoviricetes sp.]